MTRVLVLSQTGTFSGYLLVWQDKGNEFVLLLWLLKLHRRLYAWSFQRSSYGSNTLHFCATVVLKLNVTFLIWLHPQLRTRADSGSSNASNLSTAATMHLRASFLKCSSSFKISLASLAYIFVPVLSGVYSVNAAPWLIERTINIFFVSFISILAWLWLTNLFRGTIAALFCLPWVAAPSFHFQWIFSECGMPGPILS